ncbi:hypothetical protein [Chryseobacterium sp. Mn2064]|uniref:hypothetical protein n=1 Tax=Chryseobacterium sp. Mn2064 TaxID=3395263 RepID=UPI003BC3FFE2
MSTMIKRGQKIMAVGILLVILPLFLRNWLVIPDLYNGLLAGIGIGLELLAIITIVRGKKIGF